MNTRITNERERCVMAEQLNKFEEALSARAPRRNDSLIDAALYDSMEAVAGDIRASLKEYEDIKTGAQTTLVVDFDNLADGLRLARTVKGMKQRELGDKIGCKQQQIQRYEICDYEQASFARLKEVVWALGVRVRVEIDFDDKQ